MNKQIKLLILSAILLLVFPYQAWAFKIVVDAGHGGKDPGAIGVNGLQEKKVNLDIALKLNRILKDQGHEVILTRDDDRYLSLAERVEFTDQQNADLFVSIHANSYAASNRGTMVLYYDDDKPQEDYPASEAMKALSPYSKQLAQGVLQSLVDKVGTINLGLIPSAVYVARMGSVPSILVETAFLSNKQDAALLADDSVRYKMAEAIASGVTAFKPPVFLDTIGHWAREEILQIKNKGWVEGINNKYEPERALTRAEFLTLMDRMFDFDKLISSCSAESSTVTNTVYGCKKPAAAVYKDMPTNYWAYSTFTQALQLNLVQGYEDKTLRPDRPISRAEVAVLFQRLLASEPAKNSPEQAAVKATFMDVPASLWSANAVYALLDKGIINGISDTHFMPDRSITRAEMAVMMSRYKPN
ncbi:N-acetylmuramoyl-L-alanine amidase LytC precursor [compost metagenome]